MAKLFSVIGVVTVIGVTFVAGACAITYLYGKYPEIGHETVDHLDETINGQKEDEEA